MIILEPQQSPTQSARTSGLAPGAVILAAAIKTLSSVRKRLNDAQNVMTDYDRIRSAAIVQEAAAIRAEIAVLRTTHDVDLGAWVDAGSKGERPAPPASLLLLERRLGEIAGTIDEHERRISIASEGQAGAARRIQRAVADRDRVLWPAVIEVAAPVLDDLTCAVTTVLGIEVRLRSLVAALREAGNRDPETGYGAFTAASKIEDGINAARRRPAVAYDPKPGRSLIERLRSDPCAAL